MINMTSLGDSIDKLINIDVAGRGVIHTLYNRAREVFESPLTTKAAQALCKSSRFGDTVIITTGFPITPTMAPETDGPLGALILSKALYLTLGVNTVIVAEQETLDLISAMSRSLNLSKHKSDNNLTLLSFPKDDNSVNEYSLEILDKFLPSAVIAIEKVGRNCRGIYHNMRGYDISDSSIKVDQLFIKADERDILTIGIGDGGNEIGMSGIADIIRQYIPHGAVCNCPCRSGITCDTETDYLITADVSNWGAYGLAACLSAITENVESLHNGKSERNLLSIACDNGALDGVTGKGTPSVDGLTYQTNVYVVELLKELVEHMF